MYLRYTDWLGHPLSHCWISVTSRCVAVKVCPSLSCMNSALFFSAWVLYIKRCSFLSRKSCREFSGSVLYLTFPPRIRNSWSWTESVSFHCLKELPFNYIHSSYPGLVAVIGLWCLFTSEYVPYSLVRTLWFDSFIEMSKMVTEISEWYMNFAIFCQPNMSLHGISVLSSPQLLIHL